MRIKGMAYAGNNRKTTPGRGISHATFRSESSTEVDKGFVKHESKKYLVSTCPQTGKKIYAKQGKAKKGKFVVTLPKDTVIISTYGIKHWREGDLV